MADRSESSSPFTVPHNIALARSLLQPRCAVLVDLKLQRSLRSVAEGGVFDFLRKRKWSVIQQTRPGGFLVV